jgi:hypothetical protein
MPRPPFSSFNQFSPDEWWRKISFTGWAGGAVELPGKGCGVLAVVGGGVVGCVFTGADGSVVVQRAVLHMITTIKRSTSFFNLFTSQDENLKL